MPNVKYAIRFPDFPSISHNKPVSIFSKDSIIRTADTFIKTFDALGSLTEFVIQKNKTNELSKQLNAKKRALDASVNNLKEQKKIEFEEYTKRVQIQLQSVKESMELEAKRLVLEASTMANDFSVAFEKKMRNNKILRNMISEEARFLNSIKDYIENLADDYSQRKEYVVYCELQRKSLDLVNQYINEMV